MVLAAVCGVKLFLYHRDNYHSLFFPQSLNLFHLYWICKFFHHPVDVQFCAAIALNNRIDVLKLVRFEYLFLHKT